VTYLFDFLQLLQIIPFFSVLFKFEFLQDIIYLLMVFDHLSTMLHILCVTIPFIDYVTYSLCYVLRYECTSIEDVRIDDA